MELAMSDSYKDRFFDQLVKTVDRIEAKVDKNTLLTEQVKDQAERTNSRVDKLEIETSKLSRKPINPKSLNAWYRDPTILRILTYLSLALVLLVGAAIRIDIGKYL